MSTSCAVCQGHGELVRVRLVPCCAGRNAWGEVVCGCGGSPLPDPISAPCPRGCEPPGSPVPEPPALDPYAW